MAWLEVVLREVTALERLHHPNVVSYRHCWLGLVFHFLFPLMFSEIEQIADFGPEIPTLHILMEYANHGNVDDRVLGSFLFFQTCPFLNSSILPEYLSEGEVWGYFIDCLLGLVRLPITIFFPSHGDRITYTHTA